MKSLTLRFLLIASLMLTSVQFASAEYTKPAKRNNQMGVMGELYDRRPHKGEAFNAYDQTGYVSYTTKTKERVVIDWVVYGVDPNNDLHEVDSGTIDFQNVSLPSITHNEVFEYGVWKKDDFGKAIGYPEYVFSMQVTLGDPEPEEETGFWAYLKSLHNNLVEKAREIIIQTPFAPEKYKNKEESNSSASNDSGSKPKEEKPKVKETVKEGGSKSGGVFTVNEQMQYSKDIDELESIVVSIHQKAEATEAKAMKSKNPDSVIKEFERSNQKELKRAEQLMKGLDKAYKSGAMNSENKKKLDAMMKRHDLRREDMEFL